MFFFYVTLGYSLEEERVLFDEYTGKTFAKLYFQDGQVYLRTQYFYDDHGRLEQTIVDNGKTEELRSIKGAKDRWIKTFFHQPYGGNELYPLEVILKHQDYSLGKETLLFHILNDYNEHYELQQRVLIDGHGRVFSTRYDEQEIYEIKKPLEGKGSILSYQYDQEGKKIEAIQFHPPEGTRLIRYKYNEAGELIDVIRDHPLPGSSKPDWHKTVEESCDFYKGLFSSLFGWLPNDDQMKEIKQEFFKVFKEIVGSKVYILSGCQTHPGRFGVYGHGEVSDKVRITFINGIMNFPEHHIENLELFSGLHGGVNIHYLFRPHEGWSRDMIYGTMSKFGVVSSQARALAKIWKDLIREMGGVGEGGIIIHYAHSIGGTETDAAKLLMTSDELKMIKVYTFGSPTIIADQGFQKVLNYVSCRDGVAYLDPIQFIWGLFNPNCHIVYLDTFSGTPLIDHLLSNDSYRGMIEKLGKEFMETYSIPCGQ